jgi:hypothetical protein
MTTNAWAVGMAVFAAGFGASVWVILVASIRQRIAPDGLLGRVYSASRFISWGVGPLGTALAAGIAEIWGIRVMFALSGTVSIYLLFVFLKLYPHQSFSTLEEVPGRT